MLDEREGHAAPRECFEYELEDHMPRREAGRTMRAAIDRARYSELFAYNDRTRTFNLDHAAA